MSAVLSREATISVRAPIVKRDLIDHAAKVSGKTRSAFMLDASCEKAEELLADQTKLSLGADQMRTFNALLDAPVTNSDVITRLLAKPAPWER